MELSLIGETLLKPPTTTEVVYTGFWMPRGGDEGTYAIDVMEVTATQHFKVVIQTKNSEDADPAPGANELGTPQVINATGVLKWTLSNAKEWVRYMIKTDTTEDTAARLHFQFLEPQWTPN